MKNERTSARVARIAAKYLPMSFDDFCDHLLTVGKARRVWRDIRTLAASCLTQAPDRPKPKAAAKKVRR